MLKFLFKQFAVTDSSYISVKLFLLDLEYESV
jgi:hypothetical protein